MTPQSATALQPVKTSAVSKATDAQQTFDRMQQIYDSIARRAFEIFEGNGRPIGHDLSDWLQAESEMLRPLHLAIAESDDALTVTAEVPGFSASELDVHVDGNRLIISGQHIFDNETTSGRTVYSERSATEIFRALDLPTDIDGSKVSALVKDGLLKVELPKALHGKSAKVEANPVN